MIKKISAIENRSPELLANAKSKYSYQEKLTQELDSHKEDFDDVTLLKIVLWKTNRYPEISKDTLAMINELRVTYTEDSAKSVLTHLLELKGFDLPMASTVLRFACPKHLQIIDKRVYRLIMPENELKIPFSKKKKIEIYFDYIEKLKVVANLCDIPFEVSDRVLYQLDKELNSEVSINY